VVIADIDVGAAERMARQCGGQWVHMAVMDESSIARAAADIETHHGPVYGLVNCAALFAPQTPPELLNIDNWDRITSANSRGTYICNVQFGKRMAGRGGGAIVTFHPLAVTDRITGTPIPPPRRRSSL
jgi:NAD(P)-dependent dehydrogenase (short-subunit alcohol dehydrogenase family)